jgi:hypothetical protein
MFGLTPADSGSIAGGAIGLEGVGAATSLVGGYLGYEAAQGQYQSQSNIAELQKQMNALSLNQMELTGRRNQMEVLRNEQRARSLAISSSTNQGATYGSGLQGGFGQIAGSSGNNMLALAQNLSIGRQEATVQGSIIDQQLAASKYQSQAATAAGISSLGGGITSAGGSIFSAATNPSGSLFTA